MILYFPIHVTFIYFGYLLSQYSYAAVVPFRDSIELVFTPEDVKKTTDYVFWKVPEVKKNFKTTVKQKMLNMLLNKDLQDINPNPPFVYENEIDDEGDRLFAEQEHNDQILGQAQQNRLADSFQTVEIDIKKPYGLVHSVLKGPPPTGKKKAKITVHNPNVNSNKVEIAKMKVNKEKEEVVAGLPELSNEELQKFQNEHMGYLRPTKIKNDKHDFGEKFKKLPAIPNSNVQSIDAKQNEDYEDDEEEDEEEKEDDYDNVEENIKGSKTGFGNKHVAKGKTKKKSKDPFYDD